MTPDSDEYLWAILPTNFFDQQGREWFFRKLNLKDMMELEARGHTTDKLILETGMPALMTLAHQFFTPVGDTPKPSLDDYLELLVEDVLDQAFEAFRRCLTNFFPRSQRISARTLIRQEREMLQLMTQHQSEALTRFLNNMEPSESASDLPVSLESNLGSGLAVSLQ